MESNIVIAPVLINLLTAVLLLFLWQKSRMQRWLSLAGNTVMLLFAIYLLQRVAHGEILVMQGGKWAAPYGITFVVDAFSALMILLTSISGLAVGMYSTVSIKSKRVAFGFYPLLQFLLMGLCGSFIAGDIFNLYVWFEVILISSFVLITLGGEREQLAGAMKYVTLNLLASVIFLTAIAVLYGALGSLNLADLAIKVRETENISLINTIAVLFLVSFGLKAAIFPLYFWLPDSYHTPPIAISAIFGGLLTKVGVYAFIRVFSLLFISDIFIRDLLLVLSTATMIVGALGAINAKNVRIIFSFLIISHIGFMLGGLALFSKVALTGAIMYMTHDILAKTNVFLIIGILYKIKGNYHLDYLGGIMKDYPKLTTLFSITLFAIVGTPPLSGFWPKLALLKASFAAEQIMLLAGIILASFLTLWAVVRFWSGVFWTDGVNEDASLNIFGQLRFRRKLGLLGGVVLLTLCILLLSFFWPFVMRYCELIAQQLMDPKDYINSVLK